MPFDPIYTTPLGFHKKKRKKSILLFKVTKLPSIHFTFNSISRVMTCPTLSRSHLGGGAGANAVSEQEAMAVRGGGAATVLVHGGRRRRRGRRSAERGVARGGSWGGRRVEGGGGSGAPVCGRRRRRRRSAHGGRRRWGCRYAERGAAAGAARGGRPWQPARWWEEAAATTPEPLPRLQRWHRRSCRQIRRRWRRRCFQWVYLAVLYPLLLCRKLLSQIRRRRRLLPSIHWRRRCQRAGGSGRGDLPAAADVPSGGSAGVVD